MSQNGPWEEVIDETLTDSRNRINPLPLQAFSFESDTGRFVKFEVTNSLQHTVQSVHNILTLTSQCFNLCIY